MRFLHSRARRGAVSDILIFAAIIGVIVAILRFLPASDPLSVSGRPRLIDGDSLYVQGVELRLIGIDAPEVAQNCSRNQVLWPCGMEATRALRRFLGGASIICEGREHDVHDRLLATCKIRGENVNRWMVEQGWAVSFHDYPAEERSARKAGRGIWSGSFVRPREWREDNR